MSRLRAGVMLHPRLSQVKGDPCRVGAGDIDFCYVRLGLVKLQFQVLPESTVILPKFACAVS